MNIARLRKLAEKATSGPGQVFTLSKTKTKEGSKCAVYVSSGMIAGSVKPNDARFIAACSPENILKLLDENTGLKKTYNKLNERLHI